MELPQTLQTVKDLRQVPRPHRASVISHDCLLSGQGGCRPEMARLVRRTTPTKIGRVTRPLATVSEKSSGVGFTLQG